MVMPAKPLQVSDNIKKHNSFVGKSIPPAFMDIII